MLHCLYMKGTYVTFSWVPSHTSFVFNDQADRAAKRGAKNIFGSIKVDCPLSYKEISHIIERDFLRQYSSSSKPRQQTLSNFVSISRPVSSLTFRLLCNSLRTKFCQTVKCVCRGDLSVQHVIFDCELTNPFLNGVIPSNDTGQVNVFDFLDSLPVVSLVKLTSNLLKSPLRNIL